MGKLNGKVAVVTGASKGIGAEIAKELARQGAAVVVNYSTSRDGAAKVVSEIVDAGGKAIIAGGSVAKPEEIDGIFDQAKKAFGKVDILVNNAGIFRFAPIDQVTSEHVAEQFAVNVTGLLLSTKAAVALFPAEGGSVINISSVVAETAPANTAAYSGTKGAVNAITRALAKELGPRDIRVNAVSPGPVQSDGYVAAGFADSDFEKGAVQQTPLGRVGQPTDIASVVAFLASDDARWITGSIVDAAGGLR